MRAVLLHAVEHIGDALARPVGMAFGIEVVRPLGEAGEQRAFADVEVLRGLAEIAARRHLDAPRAAAEIDRIEIKLEDIGLGEDAFDARGENDLAHLALVGDVVADQQVLRHLLGDGRAALRAARRGEVADEGADEAALVDALVLVEPLVLGGDERLLHVLGDVTERHPHAAVLGLEHFGVALRPCRRARSSRRAASCPSASRGRAGRRPPGCRTG